MLGNGFAKLQGQCSLTLMEIMTILVAFHQSHYRNFKYFYIDHIQIIPGNIDDRKPIPDLLANLFGQVFADRGYVFGPLAKKLLEALCIDFFAKPKCNMKNHLMRIQDKLLSRKCAMIETIIDQLKDICQIEYSRHRSPVNGMISIICGLIAYCHQPKKPTLGLGKEFLPVK